MSKSKKEAKTGEKTYQIRPLFKDKFRPQEAKELMTEVVMRKLKGVAYNEKEVVQQSKEVADDCKAELKALGKDRYKYLVQAIVGQNKGQGVRMGSRQYWDKDTDNFATVTVIKKEIFITVCVFALYLY